MRSSTLLRRGLTAVSALALPVALVLGVSGSPASVTAASAAMVPVANTQPGFTVVRPGQTLSSIAAANHLTWRQLASFNGFTSRRSAFPDGMLRLSPPPQPLPGFGVQIAVPTAAQLGTSYAPGCPVGPDQLRMVTMTYYGTDGAAHTGQLVVNAAIADATVRAFRTLYLQRFPIASMDLAQNTPDIPGYSSTAAFNCRVVAGTATLSQHAYGLAIDVNSLENPMLKNGVFTPAEGAAYANRDLYQPGMVHSTGAARVFRANGLFWGGAWSGTKDYMHFSKNGR